MTEIDAEGLARERAEGERRENERDLDAVEGATLILITRAEAVREGFLVDASGAASAAGFRWPVSATTQAYRQWVEGQGADGGEGGEAERLRRLLRGAAEGVLAVGRRGVSTDRCDFNVTGTGPDGAPRTGRLRLVVEVGDSGEPVATILGEGEE